MVWLSQMIESPTWRQTIYELASQPRNEDCPFLSLAMPCIAVKEELISELVSVPLAWSTLDIFLKCVIHMLRPLLTEDTELITDDLYLHDIAFLQPVSNPSAAVTTNKSSHLENRETVLDPTRVESETDPNKKRIYQILRNFLVTNIF